METLDSDHCYWDASEVDEDTFYSDDNESDFDSDDSDNSDFDSDDEEYDNFDETDDSDDDEEENVDEITAVSMVIYNKYDRLTQHFSYSF